MNALAGIIAKLFGRQLDVLLGIFTRRGALRLGAIAALLAMITGLYSAVNVALAALVVVMPAQLVIAASWVVPDNFDECITAYMSASALISLYRWQRDNLKIASYIT